MGLELYGLIEPLLGFDEEAEGLYELYIELLKSWKPKKLIDIGCGNGRFMQRAIEKLHPEKVYGVDLSETMVQRARALGLKADAVDICNVRERFDAATAVFDVLNYLTRDELPRFLCCVAEVLEEGGIFLADINTLVGFEEVAPGTIVRDHDDVFLAVDADFDGERLTTRFDLFTKKGECYRRESDEIVQYYHPVEAIAQMCEELELIQSYPVTMFADEPDKEILVFRKVV